MGLIKAILVTILVFQSIDVSIWSTADAAENIVGDATRGEALTSKWCTSCHFLDGQSGGDGAPPLHGAAAKGAQIPGFLRNFLMSPHKPMPPLQLTSQEIEDVVAYFGTLTRNNK